MPNPPTQRSRITPDFIFHASTPVTYNTAGDTSSYSANRFNPTIVGSGHARLIDEREVRVVMSTSPSLFFLFPRPSAISHPKRVTRAQEAIEALRIGIHHFAIRQYVLMRCNGMKLDLPVKFGYDVLALKLSTLPDGTFPPDSERAISWLAGALGSTRARKSMQHAKTRWATTPSHVQKNPESPSVRNDNSPFRGESALRISVAGMLLPVVSLSTLRLRNRNRLDTDSKRSAKIERSFRDRSARGDTANGRTAPTPCSRRIARGSARSAGGSGLHVNKFGAE